MRGLAQEFKEFIMRGNVVALAVAVVIGVAFTDIVNSFSTNIIGPLIGVFGGTPDFSSVSFSINDSEFLIGAFINSVISFLVIALVIFFFVIKPMNMLIERQRRRETTPDQTTATCDYCKGEIPLGATRCMHCTSENPLSATSA